MKASEELSAKLQRQRLRSEGVPGSPAPEKRAVSAPTARDSLKSGAKVLGWNFFAQKSPRPTLPTTTHSRSEESRDLDDPNREELRGQKAKVGNLSTQTRTLRTVSDGGTPPRSSLRLGTRGGSSSYVSSCGRGTGIKQFATGSSEAKRRGSGDQQSAKDVTGQRVSAKHATEESKSEELQRQAVFGCSAIFGCSASFALATANRQLDQPRHHAGEDAKLIEARLREAEERIAAQTKELEDYKRNVAHLDKQLFKSKNKIAELTVQNADLVQKASSPAPNQPSTGSSESALRAVMARPGASVDELRHAIKGVEALVNEAQRELERAEYRQKRAAYEKLYEVLGKADEEQLEAALAEARRVGLNKEDVEKGEAKLQELRSMTDGERYAMESEKLKAALKPQLFLFVKKNDYATLEEEISKLSPDIAWEDWRDHNGRTLIKYADELRLFSVQEVLASLLAEKKPGAITTDAPKVISPCPDEASTDDSCSPVFHWTSPSKPGGTAETPETRTPSSGGQVSPNVPSTPPSTSPKRSMPERTVSTTSYTPRSPSTPSGPHAEEKKAAFKAASTGDEKALVAALENVPTDVWTQWQNQGGQELMEMSKNRDEYLGTSIHKLLLNMLGLIVERKYEPLDEGQAVWVFFAGDVVPRQATVREDTLADADKVLVQYWDGKDDETAEYVDRCCVNRLGS